MSKIVDRISRVDELGWEPNHPETWMFRYAVLRSPIYIRAPHLLFLDPTELPLPLVELMPRSHEYVCARGQIVKIVMVTRNGLIGITDDLTANYGPRAFVDLDMLQPCSPPALCDN